MAVKRTVHEFCPRCGEHEATLMPDGSVKVSHPVCPKGPPGPPSPPRTFRPGEVIFVPSKFKDDPNGWTCACGWWNTDTNQCRKCGASLRDLMKSADHDPAASVHGGEWD